MWKVLEVFRNKVLKAESQLHYDKLRTIVQKTGKSTRSTYSLKLELCLFASVLFYTSCYVVLGRGFQVSIYSQQEKQCPADIASYCLI